MYQAAGRGGMGSGSAAEGKMEGRMKDLADVARLVAHVGTLHWKVWAPLAYLVDPDIVEDTIVEEERGRSLRRESDSVNG